MLDGILKMLDGIWKCSARHSPIQHLKKIKMVDGILKMCGGHFKMFGGNSWKPPPDRRTF